MKALLAFALFALAFVAAPHAEARVVRQPAAGPGVTVDIPDTWVSRVAGESLIMANQTRAVAFSITIGMAEPDYDAVAAQVHPEGSTPLVRDTDVVVAGRTAAAFNSTITRGGTTASLRVYMFQLAPGHLGSVSVITRQDATQADIAEAAAVLATVQGAE